MKNKILIQDHILDLSEIQKITKGREKDIFYVYIRIKGSEISESDINKQIWNRRYDFNSEEIRDQAASDIEVRLIQYYK